MAINLTTQFFSQTNGLVLSNSWGQLVTLLDACLVNGVTIGTPTAAVVVSGDLELTFSAAHNCLLFQLVDLSGFTPSGWNGTYRIKAVTSTTKILLTNGTTITGASSVLGSVKLSSLGYSIAFTGANKRVYRANSPTAAHPFIRVDETINDGAGNDYTTTYAKYAMVGLIENMTSIDDYANTSNLQLPLDIANYSKNWTITGSGTTVVRGWAKWHWSRANTAGTSVADSAGGNATNKGFTLVGDRDAFYLLCSDFSNTNLKVLNGCGMFTHALDNSVVPNWFLMATLNSVAANSAYAKGSLKGGTPLIFGTGASQFLLTRHNVSQRLSDVAYSVPILPNITSGNTTIFNSSNVAALEVPFYDEQAFLRGTLKHVCYRGKDGQQTTTTAILQDNSMYVTDSAQSGAGTATGGFYFYLGELV